MRDLSEGKEVEIELKKKSIFGLLKGWKIDAQSLKDELREIDALIELLKGNSNYEFEINCH
jgi:predicted DNA-binding antitoxin AbrB/MazE fold protein